MTWTATNSWWSALQVCVWIVTRDEELVSKVGTKDTLLSVETALQRFADQGTLVAAIDGKPPLTIAEACRSLVLACQSGEVTLIGQEKGAGKHSEIPCAVWDDLEIRDHPELGVVAASLNDLSTGVWWGSLFMWGVQALRQWRFPLRRRRATTDFYSDHWESRRDSLTEALWAARRARTVQSVESLKLEVGDDGLPDAPEVSVTEAWSWCAFDTAIPASAWSDDEALRRAGEEYGEARLQYAGMLWRLREARSTLKQRGDVALGDPVAIKARVAQSMADNSKLEMDRAWSHYARETAIHGLFRKVFDQVKVARSLPEQDRDFPQRLGDEAERRILHAFQRGELQCLGRRNPDALIWETVPPDCFRLPISIRPNHNVFEASKSATPEQHKLICDHVSIWTDLRVDVAKLRIWRRRPADAARLARIATGHGEYVDLQRLDALRAISSSPYDLRKLIRLCEELNSNWYSGNYMSVAMVVRALIDHVPPLFGMRTFNEVESNYKGTQSFRQSMKILNDSSRKIADQHLHTAIRTREVLPNPTQVNFSHNVDVLLSEIVRLLEKKA